MACTQHEVLASLRNLLRGLRVLDAGSGSGWLSRELGLGGVTVVAADIQNYEAPGLKGAHPMRTVFQLDYQGDAVALLPGPFDAVLLVWPDHASPFAADIAEAMRPGQRLLVNGEGPRGCTADDAFFRALDGDFQPEPTAAALLNEGHVAFPGARDEWSVWVKL